MGFRAKTKDFVLCTDRIVVRDEVCAARRRLVGASIYGGELRVGEEHCGNEVVHVHPVHYRSADPYVKSLVRRERKGKVGGGAVGEERESEGAGKYGCRQHPPPLPLSPPAADI